ncbi:tetratricopeptide repeat protein [Pararhodonellum marinum]|uniref:tetratricopeptide repeat protein n=1 Tax=Pararhodonellum marinum TaxID=2755358 RepID=UPI00188EF6FE|nr:tetratricopeptide repeat protein [Pararhodonellum marinum]
MNYFKPTFVILVAILLIQSCGESTSNKGDNLYAAGDYEGAVKAYDDFLVNKPGNVKALYNRGRAYEELDDFENAKASFEAALDKDPKNVQVLMSMSNLLQKEKNHSGSLLYAGKATDVVGAPAMAFFLKGRALHRLGNTEEALREYSTAIKMNSEFGQAYYYRGMLKMATDKKSSACEDFKLASNADFGLGQEALEKFCN